MNEFINIKDQLPEKGKDIIGVDNNGDISYCFRCNCHNPNCTEWRESLSGYGLIVNIVKWKYVEDE